MYSPSMASSSSNAHTPSGSHPTVPSMGELLAGLREPHPHHYRPPDLTQYHHPNAWSHPHSGPPTPHHLPPHHHPVPSHHQPVPSHHHPLPSHAAGPSHLPAPPPPPPHLSRTPSQNGTSPGPPPLPPLRHASSSTGSSSAYPSPPLVGRSTMRSGQSGSAAEDSDELDDDSPQPPGSPTKSIGGTSIASGSVANGRKRKADETEVKLEEGSGQGDEVDEEIKTRRAKNAHASRKHRAVKKDRISRLVEENEDLRLALYSLVVHMKRGGTYIPAEHEQYLTLPANPLCEQERAKPSLRKRQEQHLQQADAGVGRAMERARDGVRELEMMISRLKQMTGEIVQGGSGSPS